MKNVKARKRQSSHLRAAAQEQPELFTDDGNLPNKIRAHGAGGIRPLIPRKEVSRKCHAHDEKRESTARDPQELAFSLVGTVEKRLQEMQEQNDDHGTRSIRVQTPQEGSARDVLDDIGYARVSGHGGRGVI